MLLVQFVTNGKVSLHLSVHSFVIILVPWNTTYYCGLSHCTKYSVGFKLSHSLWSQGYYNQCCRLGSSGEGQQKGGEFHTCHVSLTHLVRSGVVLQQLGREKLRLDDTNSDPQVLQRWILSYKCSLWLMYLASFCGTTQHSVLTSILCWEKIWHVSPKDIEGVLKKNQISLLLLTHFSGRRKWLISPVTLYVKITTKVVFFLIFEQIASC